MKNTIKHTANDADKVREMKDKMFRVRVIGNFYGGKYYETGLETFFVNADTVDEARNLSESSISAITEMYKNKKYSNGRYALRKSETSSIKFGHSDRSIQEVSGGFRTKVLMETGTFEVVTWAI